MDSGPSVTAVAGAIRNRPTPQIAPMVKAIPESVRSGGPPLPPEGRPSQTGKVSVRATSGAADADEMEVEDANLLPFVREQAPVAVDPPWNPSESDEGQIFGESEQIQVTNSALEHFL